jgi:hypothetical protein
MSSILATGRLLLVRTAKAVVPIRQTDQPLCRKLLEQLLAHWTVEDGISLFEVVKEEGGVENPEILVHAGEEPGAHH